MRSLSILLSFSFLMFFCINLSSQLASATHDIKDFFPPAIKKSILNKGGDPNNWPACSDPKDIIVISNETNITIQWDGTERLAYNYSYEIEIFDRSSSRIDQRFIANKNRYNILKDQLISDKSKFRIRRKCKVDEVNYVYSNWIIESFYQPCTGGLISTDTFHCPGTDHQINNVTSSGYTSFKWYKRTGGCESNSQWQLIPNATGHSYTITGYPVNRSYLRIDSCGQPSNCVTVISGWPEDGVGIDGPSNSCSGETLTLAAYPWSPGFSYLWNDSTTSNSITVTPVVSTSYSLTVTSDISQCTMSSMKQVVVSPLLTEITATPLQCSVNKYDLLVSVTLNTPSNPDYFVYRIDNGQLQTIDLPAGQSSQWSFLIEDLNADGQEHEIKLQNVCESYPTSFNAPFPCSCDVTILGGDTICIGETIALTASSGSFYQWNTGQTTQSISVTPSAPTTFSVTVTAGNGCTGTKSTSIVPVTCPMDCQLSALFVQPSLCSANKFDLNYSFTILNPGENNVIQIQDDMGFSEYVILNGSGTYSGTIHGITSDGFLHQVYFSKDNNYCVSSITYYAPESCGSVPIYPCSIEYGNALCNFNNYGVSGSIHIENPISGDSVRVYDIQADKFVVIYLIPGINDYNFQINNLYPDGFEHTLSLSGNICTDVPATTSYIAPLSCIPNQCSITEFEQTPGPCDAQTNKYVLSGSFKYICNQSDLITITILPENTQITVLTEQEQTDYNFEIPNLSSDNAQHTIKYSSALSGIVTKNFNAPAICSSINPVACGDTNINTNITNTTNLLQNAFPGDIFEVSGLNFLVKQISGSNGYFSGNGELPLPFNSQKLKVSFTGIKVNSDYQVIEGDVIGDQGNINFISSLQVGSLTIGGDICQAITETETTDNEGFDKLTGMNSRGFKSDSLYYPDSTKYDPAGFDYNGLHETTGTPYDNFGCDMYGYDESGTHKCERDSTLLNMRDSIIQQVIPGLLDQSIQTTLNNLLDSLSSFNCDSIRNKMNSLISLLEYDPIFIKGDKDQYFDRGMHQNFVSEPKPLIMSSNRHPDAISLEKEHIALYKCDILSIKLEAMISKLQGLDQSKLKSFINRELNKLDKTKLQNLLENNDALINWVLTIIASYAETGNGIGFNEDNDQINENASLGYSKINIKKPHPSEYFAIASNGTELESFNYKPKPGEEETWLYNQGLKSIKGIDRGYYLEQAYNLMKLKNGQLANGSDAVSLPILLNKDTAGVSYSIYIDNVNLSPLGAKLDAYFVFTIPNTVNQKVVFKALNLNWGAGGLIGETDLKLGSPVELRLSNSALLRLNPGTTDGGCYVRWDCKGFKSIGLDADVELCREFIIPLNPQTLTAIEEPSRFSFNIKMNIASWSDLYFELKTNQQKAFSIKGYEDYKFVLDSIILDMSDFKSPNPTSGSVSFSHEWRGLYIKDLNVTFPNSFSSGSNNMTAGVHNFFIDDMGVTGTIFASNIISIENGSLGGWPFSIDTAKVIIERNQLVGGGLNGRLKIPVFKKAMNYTASVLPGNKYQFSVKPSATEEMEMLLATVKLDSTSVVTVFYNGGEVQARAKLNGSLIVGTSESDTSSMTLPSVSFSNFEIGNVEPYFSAGQWTIGGGIGGSLAGFELKIDKIIPVQPSPKIAGISFNIGVTLPINISAAGGLEILGNLTEDEAGRQKWIYRETKLNRLSVHGSFAAGSIEGYIEKFAGDSIYGKGFKGMVIMDFKKIGRIDAMALFGKKEFKYFFVDASARLSTGIPVGPLDISGFVGGVSYKMNVIGEPNPQSGSNSPVFPPLGSSLSGNVYVPDITKGIGLKAGMMIKLKTEKAFNGVVVYEMLFNSESSGGGIASVSLDGKGQLMSLGSISGQIKSDNENDSPNGMSAPLRAHIRFNYDFNQSIFTGKLVAFLNAGYIQGVGTNNKMVDAQIYVGPKKWYFHFGTPTAPCGIKLRLGVVDITTESYLCIGTEIPGLPPIPNDVAAIAGNIKPNTAFASSGNGFLFGSNFEVKAKINAWIASAEMDAKAGFDLMIRDFGDAICVGSNQNIGIDGWYGVGQIWALISGKLKILGYTIFDAGIAGILQAQLPNPVYAQATMGVKIKTLFGKINKNIKISLGQECVLDYGDDGSALGMKVINQITPGDNAKSWPVNTFPQVYFNLPINTELEIRDKFLVKIKSVEIKSLKTDYVYQFDTILSDERVFMDVKLKNAFFGNDSIEFKIEIDILKNGLPYEVESESIIFTTGKPESKISFTNVESSYPIDGMANFYKDEFNGYKGFIQLKHGLPELFYNIPDGMSQKIRLSNFEGASFIYDYYYNGLEGRIEFPIDPNMLLNDKIYKVEIVRLKNGTFTTVIPSNGINIDIQASNMSLNDFMAGIVQDSSSEDSGLEEVLICILFRVSKFNTITSKLNQMVYSFQNKVDNYSLSTENFDLTEINEILEINALNTNWYSTQSYLIYSSFPATLQYDPSSELCEINMPYLEPYITREDFNDYFNFVSPLPKITLENKSTFNPSSASINCNIKKGMEQDFTAIRNTITYKVLHNSQCWGESLDRIFNYELLSPEKYQQFFKKYNSAKAGDLIFEFRYNIPGLGTTSQTTLNF